MIPPIEVIIEPSATQVRVTARCRGREASLAVVQKGDTYALPEIGVSYSQPASAVAFAARWVITEVLK